MRYLVLSLLLTSSIASAEVYKTVNPDGSVTYSDVKTENAEAITPPELTPTPAVKYPKKKPAAKADDRDKKQALPYKTFIIASPVNNGTIRNNSGTILISMNIAPKLQTDYKHSLTILLDGKVAKEGITTMQAQLNNVDRGMHSITAQIIGKDGKLIKTSASITIHMKRHSKLHVNKKPSRN